MRRKQLPVGRDAVHRLLQLFECAHFDLAHAFAADVVDLAQFLERLGVFRQAAFGEDVALTLVEAVHRLHQHFVADELLLGFCNDLVLQRVFILQDVHPLAFAFLAQGNVQGSIAAHHHPAVHVDHFGFRHAKLGGDLRHVVGMQIGVLVSIEVLLHPAEVEEQLLLGSGGAHLHEAPAAQDEFLDRGLDPPHRVSREAEAPVGFELLDALHQADVAFGNKFRNGQAIAAIAHRDLRDEAQVARHQLRCGFGVLVFLITLGEHVFLLGRKDRELLDLCEIAVEALLSAKSRHRRQVALLVAHFVSPSFLRRPTVWDPTRRPNSPPPVLTTTISRKLR